jgi:hypothetical protein
MKHLVAVVLLFLFLISGCDGAGKTDGDKASTGRHKSSGDRNAYTSIFKWSGEYSGFILDGHVFDARSHYLGWVDEDGTVWHRTGRYVGEVVEENYILRNTSQAPRAARAALVTPAAPASPAAPARRAALGQKAGWVDAWDDLESP